MSARNRRLRRHVAEELDTLPLMGLFVVLIPMLLLSAVFLEISVIQLGSADTEHAPTEPPTVLTVRLADDHIAVSRDSGGTQRLERGPDERDALKTALRALAEGRETKTSVRIVSDPGIRYDTIVTAMDVTREAGLGQAALLAAS